MRIETVGAIVGAAVGVYLWWLWVGLTLSHFIGLIMIVIALVILGSWLFYIAEQWIRSQLP